MGGSEGMRSLCVFRVLTQVSAGGVVVASSLLVHGTRACMSMLVCVTWSTNPQRLIHPQDCSLKTYHILPRQ